VAAAKAGSQQATGYRTGDRFLCHPKEGSAGQTSSTAFNIFDTEVLPLLSLPWLRPVAIFERVLRGYPD